MKNYKFFLLATAAVMVALSSSLSANPRVMAEELADKIRTVRSCPAPKAIESIESGWSWSSFRRGLGNGLRWAGNQLRIEDTKTGIGQTRQAGKKVLEKVVYLETGVSFTESMFNAIGNGLRRAGEIVRGYKETENTTRIVLNNLELNKSSDIEDIKEAMTIAATAYIKADEENASQDYSLLVQGLNKRGYNTQTLDANQIYIEALAEEIVRTNGLIEIPTAANVEILYRTIKKSGIGALEKVASVKYARSQSERIQARYAVLKAAFEQANAKVAVESAHVAPVM